jgi:hypothetical protein
MRIFGNCVRNYKRNHSEFLKGNTTSSLLYEKAKQSSPATRHGGVWGERRYSSYSFTTSAVDGVSGQRHASAVLCPGERTPGTHCTGGWVGPKAGLDTEVRGNILCPCRGSNLNRPIVQPVARHYTAWATPAPFYMAARGKYWNENRRWPMWGLWERSHRVMKTYKDKATESGTHNISDTLIQ